MLASFKNLWLYKADLARRRSETGDKMTSKKGIRKFWRILRESVKNRKFKREINYGEVRLYDSDGYEFCPLTYVAFKANDCSLDTGDWNIAASKLGIDKNYAYSIIDAADTDMEGLTGKSYQVKRRIRRKLLKTLKLKEPKSD